MTRKAVSARETNLYSYLRKVFPSPENVTFDILRMNYDKIQRETTALFGSESATDVGQHLQTKSGKLEIAFIGQTGAGKSTLFNALTGIRLGRVTEADAEVVSRNVLRCESKPSLLRGQVKIDVLYISLADWEKDRDMLSHGACDSLEELREIMENLGYKTENKLYKDLIRMLGDQPPKLRGKFGERVDVGIYPSYKEARVAINQFDGSGECIAEIIVSVNLDGKLPRNVSLIDIPGVGDSNPLRNKKSRRFLREHQPHVFYCLPRNESRVKLKPWRVFNLIDDQVGVEKILVVRTKWDGLRREIKVTDDLQCFRELLIEKYQLRSDKHNREAGDSEEDVEIGNDLDAIRKADDEAYRQERILTIECLEQIGATVQENPDCVTDTLPADVEAAQYEIFDIDSVRQKLRKLAKDRGEALLVEVAAVANGWHNFDYQNFKSEAANMKSFMYLSGRDARMRKRAKSSKIADTVRGKLKQHLDSFGSNHRGLRFVLKHGGHGEVILHSNGIRERRYIDLNREILSGFVRSRMLLRGYLRNLVKKIAPYNPPRAVMSKIEELQRIMIEDLDSKPMEEIVRIMKSAYTYVDGEEGMQATKQNILKHYDHHKQEIAKAVGDSLVMIREKATFNFEELVKVTLEDYNRVKPLMKDAKQGEIDSEQITAPRQNEDDESRQNLHRKKARTRY